jgi:hypothetical protein
MTTTKIYVYRYYSHSIVYLAFTKLCYVDMINFHLILRTEKFRERNERAKRKRYLQTDQ